MTAFRQSSADSAWSHEQWWPITINVAQKEQYFGGGRGFSIKWDLALAKWHFWSRFVTFYGHWAYYAAALLWSLWVPWELDLWLLIFFNPFHFLALQVSAQFAPCDLDITECIKKWRQTWVSFKQTSNFHFLINYFISRLASIENIKLRFFYSIVLKEGTNHIKNVKCYFCNPHLTQGKRPQFDVYKFVHKLLFYVHETSDPIFHVLWTQSPIFPKASSLHSTQQTSCYIKSPFVMQF